MAPFVSPPEIKEHADGIKPAADGDKQHHNTGERIDELPTACKEYPAHAQINDHGHHFKPTGKEHFEKDAQDGEAPQYR